MENVPENTTYVDMVVSQHRSLLPVEKRAVSCSTDTCNYFVIGLRVFLNVIGLGITFIALIFIVSLIDFMCLPDTTTSTTTTTGATTTLGATTTGNDSSFSLITFGDGMALTRNQVWITCACGYGTGLILLAAYFLWENGPCHWHQKHESAYLAACFFLIILTSALLSSVDRSHQSALKNIVDQIVCIRILDRMTVMEMHPKFHDNAGARDTSKNLNPAGRNFRARRAAKDIDLVLKDIYERKEGRILLLSTTDKTLPWVIFVLNTTIAAIGHLPESRFTRVALTLGLVFEMLSILSFIACLWKKYSVILETQKIDTMVAAIVERKDENELQYVLTNVSMGSLVEVVSWKTIQRLTTEALDRGMLTVLSKAILIDAFQKARMQSFRRQDIVRQIIMSISGGDMTRVKNWIDGSGTYNNLYKLIYHDITHMAIRVDVLRHLATESQALRRMIGMSNGIKILSDVDDTLYSSGGKFPAGCDTSFPGKVVYPGFLPLLQVLDQERTAQASSCNVVFLSARPHVYKDVAEDHSYQLFRNLVQMGSMHTIPTLLPGKLSQGIRAMACFAFRKTEAWRPVGEQKMSTFVKYQKLYSEYDFIFCGDNGQGDLLAGQLMLRGDWRDESEKSRVLAVLIHQVLPDDDSLALEPVSSRGVAWHENQRGLYFHQGYVGAAVALHAQHPQLISVEQLAMIANRAVEEFDEARLMYSECSSNFAVAEINLRNDLAKADAVVRGAGLPKLKSLISLEELLGSFISESIRSSAHTVELSLRKGTLSFDH